MSASISKCLQHSQNTYIILKIYAYMQVCR
jgi:hypothetical protein